MKRIKLKSLVRALFFLSSFLVLNPVIGATLPANFFDTLANPNADINKPTAMAFAPDGRLFVCEQGGNLRVIKGGSLLSAPFLTLPSATFTSAGERGLLGVAFDPDYGSNGYLYVYSTHIEASGPVTFDGAITISGPVTYNRVSRFTADPLDPDIAQAASEVVLLNLYPLSTATNHNGGALHFGGDGKLYIAAGENAAPSNSQTTSNLLGKISRINPDGSIPADNPFYGTVSGNNRAIWVLGLRNPFTFNFQRGSGRLFINDVGDQTWEEVDEGAAGLNFGWNTTEGDFNTATYPSFTLPAYTYNSAGSGPVGTECAITGGTFYDPATALFPAEYTGRYFFSDYCGNWIRYLESPLPSAGTTTATSFGFATGYTAPVGLEAGPDGALYVLTGANSSAGRVYRIYYAAPATTATPTPTAIPALSPTPTSTPGALSFSAAYPVPSFGIPISVELFAPGNYSVNWKIFTEGGWRIRRGRLEASGASRVEWDMKDDWGFWAANGIYFLHLEVKAGNSTSVKNLKLLVER